MRNEDEIHRWWLAGYDAGYAKGIRAAVEDMARALLHEQAAEMAGTAVHAARQNHGEGWAQEIARQAAGDSP